MTIEVITLVIVRLEEGDRCLGTGLQFRSSVGETTVDGHKGTVGS